MRTNASTGVFRAFEGLNSYCPDVLASLPVAAASAPATPTVARVAAAKTTTKPKTADSVTISANNVIVKEAK